jgi:hypothetical protein
MFEDFEFAGPGQTAEVAFGDGDFYVRSSGRLSVTPNSSLSRVSSSAIGPSTKTAAFGTSSARILSASVSRGIGQGMGSSISYAGIF